MRVSRIIFAATVSTAFIHPLLGQVVIDSLDDPGLPDDGMTTLREALDQANQDAGTTIFFDPDLADGTIYVGSPLPIFTGGSITINGDLDFDGTPDITISGTQIAGNANGLVIESEGNIIHGLRIIDFSEDGIVITGDLTQDNTISGCFIEANANHGINIRSGAGNTVIGPSNFIAANGHQGVRLAVGVQGNTIQTNSITNNGQFGIKILDICAQNEVEPPVITSVDEISVSGTSSAPDGSEVQVFSDPFFEGQTLLGVTSVLDGEFQLFEQIPKGTVTATVTDLQGNTSEFAWMSANDSQASPRPGDYLITSRTFGTVYAIDPSTGLIRGLVSGLDDDYMLRGQGPSLDDSWHNAMLSIESDQVFIRFASIGCGFGVIEVNANTGDREFISGTDLPIWEGNGDIIEWTDDLLLVTSDGFDNGIVSVYSLNMSTFESTPVSDPSTGDGPVLFRPLSLALLDSSTAVVVESSLGTASGGVFLIDLSSGDRSFLSRLSINPFVRDVIEDGEGIGEVILGDDEGGNGPVSNQQQRSVVVIDNRIFVGFAIRLPNGSGLFNGGILEIDPDTGDRTLIVGQAYVDDGTAQTIIEVLPTNAESVLLDDVVGLTDLGSDKIAFTTMWGALQEGTGPLAIYEYDLITGELFIVSDLGSQLSPEFASEFRPTDMTIVPSTCPDFDGDGQVGAIDLAILLGNWGPNPGHPAD